MASELETGTARFVGGGGGIVTVNVDGTVNWGATAEHGRLTWDTNDAVLRALVGKNLKLGANNQNHLTISSATGLASFSNGITVDDAAGGMAQIQTGGAITMADDASVTLSTSNCQGALVNVYNTSFGNGVLFYVSYSTAAVIISDPSSFGAVADTDGKMCMIKSTNSHACTFKNRLGAQYTFRIAQLGGTLI